MLELEEHFSASASVADRPLFRVDWVVKMQLTLCLEVADRPFFRVDWVTEESELAAM
jgi:hypothetical protein